MEGPSSFQRALEEKLLDAFHTLAKCREQLEQAAHESAQHDGKSSAKAFAQSLPPLAFEIAREAKELIARAEEVVVGVHADGEDFS